MSYRKWLDDSRAPSWARAKWFGRWLYLVATFADAIGEAAIQAVRARFIDTCPPDAVPYIGEDRQIEIGIGESIESYRERLKGAWKAWEFAGTEGGLLGQLRAWLPGATWSLIANREWSVPPMGRPASPGLVAIDGSDWWSRMWVICQTDKWQSDGLWDDPGVWDDGGTWDSTALPYHVETCKRIVRKWKAGHEFVPEIVVLLGEGGLWDFPEGTWDDPGAWDSGTVVRWHIG